MREVSAADVWGESDTARTVAALAGRVAGVDGLIAKWRAKMRNPDLVDVEAGKLAELTARHRELSVQLADAQREAAAPTSEVWGAVVPALAAHDGSDDLRLKVRAALRRCIASVTACSSRGVAWPTGWRL